MHQTSDVTLYATALMKYAPWHFAFCTTDQSAPQPSHATDDSDCAALLVDLRNISSLEKQSHGCVTLKDAFFKLADVKFARRKSCVT